jgi:hypothetical protein
MKRRHSGKYEIKSSRSKITSYRAQITALKQQWADRKASVYQFCSLIGPDGPHFSMQISQLQHETELLNQLGAEISRLSNKEMVAERLGDGMQDILDCL